MVSILFVDDDANVRNGIRRVLHRMSDRWRMTFCENGSEAIALVEQTPFDVVVTDIGLPGRNGSELLHRVLEISPLTIRVVLSGRSDPKAADSAAPIAHRFVDKPCDPHVLKDVLQRCIALQGVLREPRLRGLMGGVSAVPTIPAVYQELTRAIETDDAPVAELARIVRKDPLICAKLLQLVNSAFYGTAQQIVTIEQALAYLGTDTVRNLVLNVEVFERTPVNTERTGLDIEAAQRHAIHVATLAHRIAGTIVAPETAFTAGLLHDVGSLFLASRRPAVVERVRKECGATGRTAHAVERQLLGSSHAELGAYLMGLWGLPGTVVEGIAYHHAPASIDVGAPGIATLLHVAQALLNEAHGRPSDLDVAHLERLGLASQLEPWRATAAGVADDLALAAGSGSRLAPSG